MRNQSFVIDQNEYHWFIAGSATMFILVVLCCLWHR